MSDVTDSFSSRPVVIKHKRIALFYPAAYCIAQIASDTPVLLFQISIFAAVMYFMVGLTASASTFSSYWIIVVSSTMVSTLYFRLV